MDEAVPGQRSALASVLGVAVIQVVVFIVMTGFWMGAVAGAAGACADACDWAGSQRAALLYFGFAAASFAVTAIGAVVAHRTGRDLAWVPLAASPIIVIGYVAATSLFTQAMS